MIDVSTYQRIKIVVLSFIILAAVLFPISVDSSHKSVIDALAPFEVVADRFREPMGVVVDEDGVVYVSDRKAGMIFEITDGKVEPLVRGLDHPVGLAFDSEGRLLIIEQDEGRLLRIEDDGNLTVVTEGMKDPRWVAVGEDGTIYISAEGLKSKRKSSREKFRWFSHRWGAKWNDDDDDEDENYDKADGEVILRLKDGQLLVFADGFEDIKGLAVNAEYVFAAAEEHKEKRHKYWKYWRRDHEGVFKIVFESDGSAGAVTRFTQKEIEEPLGLVRDALGALYVSGEKIRHGRKKKKEAIGKVDPEGAVTHFASRLTDPRGMAFDGLGNLYIADGEGRGRGRLIRFSAPPPPYITLPAFTNQSPLIVNGTTEPNSHVDLFINDDADPETVLAEAGNFSLILDLTFNPNPTINFDCR